MIELDFNLIKVWDTAQGTEIKYMVVTLTEYRDSLSNIDFSKKGSLEYYLFLIARAARIVGKRSLVSASDIFNRNAIVVGRTSPATVARVINHMIRTLTTAGDLYI